MNSIPHCLLLLAALTAISSAHVTQRHPAPLSTRSDGSVTDISPTIRKKLASCSPLICFVLDGSDALSKADYKAQKNFITLVAALISKAENQTFSAMQAGGKSSGFSPMETIVMPPRDIIHFIRKVSGAKRTGPSSKPLLIRNSIGQCVRQLHRWSLRKFSKKVVVFADGETGYEDLKRREPWLFPIRPFPGVVGVAVKFDDGDVEGFEQVVGKGNVLRVEGWGRLLSIAEAVVKSVCPKDHLKW